MTTCTTIYGEKIRLACIDTPELKLIKGDDIRALETRDLINSLLANKEVFIKE